MLPKISMDLCMPLLKTIAVFARAVHDKQYLEDHGDCNPFLTAHRAQV